MKSITTFLIILCFSISVSAQKALSNDPCNLIKKIDDGQGGAPTLVSRMPLLIGDGKLNGFSIQWVRQAKSDYVLSIQSFEQQGISLKNATLEIMFSDSSTLILKNNCTDCKGKMTVFFGEKNKAQELQQLRDKLVSKIKIVIAKTFIEKIFTKENTQVFYQTMYCLNT